MGKTRWYKRDPEAALIGMSNLTLAERGAYNGFLDLIYSRDGNLPDDDLLISRALSLNPRTWRKYKTALIAKGKIWEKSGKLTGKRVEYCLNEAANFSEIQRKRANLRWNNNDPAIPSGNTLQPQPQPQRKKEDYAFFGDVIKILPDQMERWHKSFPGLNGTMTSHLEGLDAWLVSHPEKQEDWFQIVPNALAKKNEKALAKNPKPKHRNIVAGSPEWEAQQAEINKPLPPRPKAQTP